jgi:hypothetical protein
MVATKMSKSSYLLSREACPRCRSYGKDSKGDNLAIYSDGHKNCYACGYYIPSVTTIGTVKEKLTKKDFDDGYKRYPQVCDRLPLDITPYLSLSAREWLMPYGLAPIETRRLWWSDYKQQLIYPVFDEEGHLLMWQARNFGEGQKKYFTSGNVADTIHILPEDGVKSPRPLILVEDAISAIKVSRYFRAMPLFGGYITSKNLIRLRDHVLGIKDELGIWLDPDKHQDGLELRDRARELGIDAFLVISKCDPKLHSDTEISELVNHWRLT